MAPEGTPGRQPSVREEVHGRVVNWKILVHQWKNNHSFRDELSHHLVFTNNDEEPGGPSHVWTVTQSGHESTSLDGSSCIARYPYGPLGR